MTSLTPSTFTSMGQDNLGVPYDPQGSIVKGLPDELHEIATLFKTVEGFPTDLHSLSQEQTKVVEDLIASLVSPEIQSLFDQDEDQETADESVLLADLSRLMTDVRDQTIRNLDPIGII